MSYAADHSAPKEMSGLNNALLPVLGNVARLARAAGLGELLGAVRDASDRMFLQLGKPPIGVKTEDFEIRGYLRHRSFLHFVAHGDSSFFRGLFMASLEPGMTVVDGGACIGLYSLLASRHVGSGGMVMAFEPDPYNFQALSFNIRQNRCTNVVALQRALAGTVGKVTFYQNPSPLSSSLIDRTDVDRGKGIEVEATTLTHELRDTASRPLLIKMDVEGAEVLALCGMREILQRRARVVLLLEVHPSILGQAGLALEDLLIELESLRFQAYLIDEFERRLIPVTRRDPLGKGYLYCSRA